jgi:hypothetical protein
MLPQPLVVISCDCGWRLPKVKEVGRGRSRIALMRSGEGFRSTIRPRLVRWMPNRIEVGTCLNRCIAKCLLVKCRNVGNGFELAMRVVLFFCDF